MFSDNLLADDMTLADLNRMDFHLRQSLDHLVDFFDLEAPNNNSSSSSSSSAAAAAVNATSANADQSTICADGRGNSRLTAQTLGPNAPGKECGPETGPKSGRLWMSRGGVWVCGACNV